ncbi:MAG: indolepyruvate ferredoxin oxidoreductase subunit alpha [Candidatus Micrarchaeia archaeon]
MEDVLKPKGNVLLLGDEAIVRGALEAGISISTTYPGTPVSEVGDLFCKISKETGVYFEYCTNEKVAAEVAAGAAFSGLRSMVSFKHFGFNVASDSVFPLAYHGVKGGMVIVFSDDPNCWSSGQSEQDTRFFAKIGHMPMLEPSNSQEAKDFTKFAFELSEKYGIPAIIRMTTRVAYGKSIVKLGEIKKGKSLGEGEFKKDDKWNTMPPKIIDRHKELHDIMLKLEEESEKSEFNKVIKGDKGGLGIIATGVSFNYALEACDRLNRKLPILKLSFYPYPKKKIAEFIKEFELKNILVVEEIEDFVAQHVKSVVADNELKIKVHGNDLIPPIGEMRTEKVVNAIVSILNLPPVEEKKTPPDVFKRDPILCPGCPHRASFWNTKEVLGRGLTYGGDIGCYILGIYNPIDMQDYIISMGAGTGIAHGIHKATGKTVVSFMGDSTFFHAGLPEIANAIYNQSDMIIIILDNGTTAMTGQQPHAGTGIRCGESAPKISIEEVCRAMGADVYVVNPFDTKKSQEIMKAVKEKKGVRVVVYRQPCRLMFMRNARKNKIKVPIYQIHEELCKKCGRCIEYGCPAIHYDKKENKYYISEDMCWGCTVCSQICPYSAIKPKISEDKKA